MFSMTSAETLGMIAICLLIGIPAVMLLSMWAASAWPGYDREREPHSGSDLGAPGHVFAERYEREGYTSQLLRVQARIPVIYRPDPVEPVRVCDPTSPYRVELAQLVAQAQRYVAPIPTEAPVSPARHYSGTVDTAARHSEYVGGHRALPELVAA